MNKKKFFMSVRKSLFHGRLTSHQVEGMDKIINYRDSDWPGMIDEELAYLLATVKWETGHTMQPIEEGQPGLKGEALHEYQKGLRYYPYYGRGLVQITWERNYAKFKIKDPASALEWPVALRCLFEGSVKGMYTGKKLADFINKRVQNYYDARTVINGHDKAQIIADYATKFLAALREAYEPAPAPQIIKNVTEAPGTTLLGLLSWVYAFVINQRIDIGLPINEGWVAWVVIGLILIFFIGGNKKSGSKGLEDVPVIVEQKETPTMNILTVISAIEKLAFIIEKVANDIPQIKQDLANLNSEFVKVQQQPPVELESRVSDLMKRIESLGDK